MTLLTIFRWTVGPLLALALLTPASGITIDTLETPQSQMVRNSAQPSTPTSTVTGPGIIGGARLSWLQWISGPGDVTFEVDAGGSQLAELVLDPDTFGQATVQYGGPTGCCLADIDITDGGTSDGFVIDIALATTAFELWVFAASDTGANSNDAWFTIGATASPMNVYVPFSALVNQSGSGADFTNIDLLTFRFEPLVAGASVTFGGIDTTMVPEPATGLLVGMGALFLGWRRRLGHR